MSRFWRDTQAEQGVTHGQGTLSGTNGGKYYATCVVYLIVRPIFQMISVIIRSIIFSSLVSPAFVLICLFFGKALLKGESFDPMVFLLYPVSVLVGSFISAPLSAIYGVLFYGVSLWLPTKEGAHKKIYACSIGGIISLLIATVFILTISSDLLLSPDSLIYIIPSVFCGVLIPLILKRHTGRNLQSKEII